MSDSELEPQDSSDSESVHTNLHSPESESGKGANNAKRKAESSAGRSDGRAAKARKTESNDFETSGSDSDNDDDDIPATTGYVTESFLAEKKPLSDSEGTAPTVLALHPSFPKSEFDSALAYLSADMLIAAIGLYRSMFPHSKQFAGGRLSPSLDSRQVKRIPVVSHRFSDAIPQNVASFLMQVVGDVVPDDKRCDKCTKGVGVYNVCVAVRDPDLLPITGGACANCWYHRQGSKCTLRTGPLPPATVPAKQTPIPVPKPPRHVSQLPALDAPAPLHPSYAAALAAGAAAAVAKTAPVSTSNGAAQGRSLTIDDRVRVWENRYSGMTTDNLVAAQEHLNEWQEDLTTRMMAMNKVVLQRLKKREGSS